MAAQREWFEKDYYKVLGVASDATPKEITKAYRKLARENHPDANPGNDAAEERFKEISSAYDVVGDAERRKEYDEVRRLGPMAGGPGGGFGPGGFSFDVGDAGLGDLLGGLFGGANRGPRGRSGRGAGPQRGTDVEATLSLSFEDAATGRVLHVRGVRCPAGHHAQDLCHVSGSWSHGRQPGAVLLLLTVPHVWWRGADHRVPVQHVPRQRHRTSPSRGQGAHPGWCRSRPTHPDQGPGCPRS